MYVKLILFIANAKFKNQITPYLVFHLFYRKFGMFTNFLCKRINYKCIGRVGEFVSKYLKYHIFLSFFINNEYINQEATQSFNICITSTTMREVF